MLLTVVYGVYTVFFEGKGKSGTQEIAAISATAQLENLNAFITKVAEASKAGLSEEDKYIIELAETEWKQDPLINAKLTDRPKDELKKPEPVQKSIPDLEISYTGFMQMGDIKFAIINGVEYAIGDRLEQGDYILRSITPSRVVIVSTGPNKKRYTFKLEE